MRPTCWGSSIAGHRCIKVVHEKREERGRCKYSTANDRAKSPHLRGPSLISFVVSENLLLVRATTPSQKELHATVPDPDTWLGCIGRKETWRCNKAQLRSLHSSFLGQYGLQKSSPPTHGHKRASNFLQSPTPRADRFSFRSSAIFYRFQDPSLLPPPASTAAHGYFDSTSKDGNRTRNPVLSSKTLHQSRPRLVPCRQRMPPRLNSAPHNMRITIRLSSKKSPMLQKGLDIGHITLKKSEIAVLVRLELQSSMPNRTPSGFETLHPTLPHRHLLLTPQVTRTVRGSPRPRVEITVKVWAHPNE